MQKNGLVEIKWNKIEQIAPEEYRMESTRVKHKVQEEKRIGRFETEKNKIENRVEWNGAE